MKLKIFSSLITALSIAVLVSPTFAQNIQDNSNTIPIQATVICLSKLGNPELKPLVNSEINNGIDGTFLSTDENGYFYLPKSYHYNVIKPYLAVNGVIDLDCEGRMAPVQAGQVILGMNGHECPCPNNS